MTQFPAHPSGKDQLRDRFKKIRAETNSGMAESASQNVWSFLRNLPDFDRAKGIGAFASIPGEIDTLSILEGVLGLGKKLYLPKMEKDKSHFIFYPVTDLKNLAPGAFGIMEPTGRHPAAWEELDLVLVPGLAFDPMGNRLGFGKGYYDRALPSLKNSALTVGLAYSFQIVEQLPADQGDVPVKALLTEKGYQICRR